MSAARLPIVLVLAMLGGREYQLDATFDEIVRTGGAEEALAALDGADVGAVLRLRRIVRRGDTAVERGWATVALTRVGGRIALKELRRRAEDGRVPSLERTWAAAGWILRAPLDEVFEMIPTLKEQLPGLVGVIEKRARELPDDQWRAFAARALAKHGRRDPKEIEPWITARGAAPLVTIALGAKYDSTRAQATRWLGTLAARGADVAGALADGLRFDPRADAFPWEGGALWMPTMSPSREEATAIACELLAWAVRADRLGATSEVRRIDRALRTAAVSTPLDVDWENGRDVIGLLRSFAAVAGEDAVVELLVAQARPGTTEAALVRAWIARRAPPGADRAAAAILAGSR